MALIGAPRADGAPPARGPSAGAFPPAARPAGTRP